MSGPTPTNSTNITCKTCGKEDVPDWNGKDQCIKCARDAALGSTNESSDEELEAIDYNEREPHKYRNEIIAWADRRTAAALSAIGEPLLGDLDIAFASYDDVVKTIRWYNSRIKDVAQANYDQEKLIDFVIDPKTIAKAVEGSMERRQALLDRQAQANVALDDFHATGEAGWMRGGDGK